MKSAARITLPWLALAVLVATTSPAGATEETTMDFASPVEVWQGYDPEELPLDIEILESWQEGSCWFEKLRFTGEVYEGYKTRVLAVRGGPIGQSGVPGLLHTHGGGQTVMPQWVRFWAKRGYACVSYDFCGPAYDRTEYTDWGPLIHCNMHKPWDGYVPKPGVRNTSWYHWIVAARRALTVLARTQGVDPERLGVFGASVGGQLSWMVAGTDPRIKAAAPLYGCGYLYDPRRARWGPVSASEDDLAFRRCLSAEANAPYIRGAVLFLSGTNDMHGWMPQAYEILGAVDAPTRQVFTPRYDHHVEPEQAASLPLWMDWRLKGGPAIPESPRLSLSLDSSGNPLGLVVPDKPADVARVELYYSLDDKVPGARFWRTTRPAQSRGKWSAALPVMDIWKSLSVFANVFYSSGLCLSSNLVEVLPGQLGRARATLRWTSDIDGDNLLDKWYFVPAYVDPHVDWGYLMEGSDSSGRYMTLNPEASDKEIWLYIGSHFPGDEQYQGKPGKALAFDVKGGFLSEMEVVAVRYDRLADFKRFSTKVEVRGSDWQRVVVTLSALTNDDGECPQEWAGIDKIELVGRTWKHRPPCFRGFQWVDAPGDGG